MADYIDRGVLITHLKKDPLFELVERYGITRVIESIPAADVNEQKTGEWLNVDNCMTICSECNGLGCGTPYCSYCGAKMSGGNEDG